MTTLNQAGLNSIPGFKGTVKLGLDRVGNRVAQVFFQLTHSGFALLGLTVVFSGILLTVHPELRQAGELKLISWLQTRQDDSGNFSELDAVDRATATNPKDLPAQQAAVAFWISKKYRVAPEPVGALVAEAFEVGKQVKIDPTLLLAVMAVESGFNPFAQSSVGAQGLMQVMTKVHSEKYNNFGGKLAAFDPVTNLRVGAKVLQECIAKAGSLERGLKFYVGAANLETDSGYANKVLAERNRLMLVSKGKSADTQPVVSVNKKPAPTEPVELSAAMDEKVAAL